MRCWPISVIRTSALLPGDCAFQLDQMCRTHRLSGRTFDACDYVAKHTAPVEMQGLVTCMHDDPVLHFAYATRPPPEQWERLERAVIVERAGSLTIVISTEH